MAHFWRGPITSKPQAANIIRWTGWLFISLAIIPIVFSAYAPRVGVYFSFITAISATVLLWKQSLWAARLLFGLMSLVMLWSIVEVAWVAWYEVSYRYNVGSGAYLLQALVVGLLTWLSWRAMRAAAAWPRLDPMPSAVDDAATPLPPPWLR